MFKRKPDNILLITALALVSLGIIMIFSASSAKASLEIGNPYYFLKNTLIRVFIGLVGMYFAYRLDYKAYKIIIPYMLGFGIVLLAITLSPVLAGRGAVKGAQRWISIMNIDFQPAEYIKLILVIFLAVYISAVKDRIKSFTKGLLPIFLPVAIILALIIKQPNYSAVIGISIIVFFMVIIGGADLRHILAITVIEGLIVLVFLVGSEHSYERLASYMGEGDPLNETYQTNQALIALGSGSAFGLGIGESKQKLFYLPEAHTDFILAIIGEEFGFIGTLAVMLGFLILTWRGIKIALRANDPLGFLLASGITSLIFLHFVINVGVVTALLPTTGIPLPFMSYGGSSLLFTLIGIGILLNISTQLKINIEDSIPLEKYDRFHIHHELKKPFREKLKNAFNQGFRREENEIHTRWRGNRWAPGPGD
ncbi:putative lipid II flippase FtsW [bacterium]|nr:putative lipid II flippase FtsW [bacterium]